MDSEPTLSPLIFSNNGGYSSSSSSSVSQLPSTVFGLPTSFVFISITAVIVFIITISVMYCYYTLRANISLRNTTLSYPNDIVPENRNEDEQVSHHVITIDGNDESLDWLPVFTYSSITENKSCGDCCAVCLTKFEAKDRLRQLPVCCHAFHVECIDLWLKSNPTCPLCRSTINPSEEDFVNIIISATLYRESTINPSEADNTNTTFNTLNRESTINPSEADNTNTASTTFNRESTINPSEADNMNIISATLNRE